ncbi:8-oxoguanine DNA glycosylase OGG fold protein [Streptomyces sp. NPDC054834]
MRNTQSMTAAEVDLMPTGTPLRDRGEVLGQAIPFDRARWLPLLPSADWWPPELDDCPTVAGRRRVDRNTVFGVACRSDTVEGRRHLLIAALVWGTGTKARSVARRADIFAAASAGDIDARLEGGLGALREEGPVAAYYAFNNDQHIKFLGPAFFTKVIYFAGHEQCDGAWRPLILDRFVALALRAADTGEKWPTSGWTTPLYRQYLFLAHEHAQKAGVLPDQIEATLFARGKQLA